MKILKGPRFKFRSAGSARDDPALACQFSNLVDALKTLEIRPPCLAAQNLLRVVGPIALKDFAADAVPQKVGLKPERIERYADRAQSPVRALAESVSVKVFVFVFSKIPAEFIEKAIGDVEMSPSLGVAYRCKVSLTAELRRL